MTVESDIFDGLKGLVSNRCFPDFAPVSTQRPYITYIQIGGEAVSFIENTVPSKKNGMFQVNVWAESRAQATQVALAIEAVMVISTAFQARPLSAVIADFDPDIPVYGTRQDFSIWSDR
jgi:hypothetical protein